MSTPESTKDLKIDLSYNRVGWVNGSTPLNAENLNIMDSALDSLINGNSNFNGISTIVKSVKNDVKSLKDDLISIETNINSLNTLSGKVTIIEDKLTDLNTDIEELSENVSNNQSNISNALSSVELLRQTKVESGKIRHTKSGEKESVTRNGQSLDIVVDAYTKNETDTNIRVNISNYVDPKLSQLTTNLESYIESNDSFVNMLESDAETLRGNVSDLSRITDSLVSDVSELEKKIDNLPDLPSSNIPDNVLTDDMNLILYCGSSTKNIF